MSGRGKKLTGQDEGLGQQKENHSDNEDHEEVVTSVEVTREVVIEALKRARGYIAGRTGKKCCMNIAFGPTESCDCIFELRRMNKVGICDELHDVEYYLACEEMSNWFESARLIEQVFDNGDIGMSCFQHKFESCVWLKPQSQGRSHTKMVNLTWQREYVPDELVVQTNGTWDGHDWEVREEDDSDLNHATLCLQTMLLVWQMIVGRDDWKDKSNGRVKKWIGRNYRSILTEGGRNAEQLKKQKLRQRLFYSRIADFMESKKNAHLVKTERCLESFMRNRWTKTVGTGDKFMRQERSYIRHDYGRYHLNTIHILRSDSDVKYNPVTKNLVDELKIKVATIQPANMDFLERLFSLVRKTQSRNLVRVSRDHKLLFLPFHTCNCINDALEVYFTCGRGSKRGEIKTFMENVTYNESITNADMDVSRNLLSMIDGCNGKVAFQPSLIVTDVHKPQEPHIDYDRKTGNHLNYMVAFLPLTETGQFLQLWKNAGGKNAKPTRGEIVFIPRGQLVLVPGDTIHGGGFRADHRTDLQHAHMRLHFYVYPGEDKCMVGTHKNEYVDPGRKRYLPSPELLNTPTSLNTCFFHGRVEPQPKD
jgi:hypothetical protein